MKIALLGYITDMKTRFLPYIEKYKDDMELIYLDCPPTIDSFPEIEATGCEGIFYINTCKESEEFFKGLADIGVKYICAPSTGYDHFNIEAMRKYGIRGANVPFYSPNAIAEHTVMLALSLLRNLRSQIYKIDNYSYDKRGLLGRELRNMVVGIVGAGRIGYTTMKCLSGFGPKEILAYAHHQNEAVKELATYVSLEELYERADMIIYHCTLNDENYHMVNRETIATMKDGVVLINTARGGVFDSETVLEGLESGKISAVGLDVIEGEGVLNDKVEFEKCPLPILEKLLAHENVIFTQHTAFYTDEAIGNLSEFTMDNMYEYIKTGKCKNEVVFIEE